MLLPPIECARGVTFDLRDFFEAGEKTLALELVTGGDGMGRVIEEPVTNRLGLALTGFYEHFAWRRLQLMGRAEVAYLDSLPAGVRRERLEELAKRKVFCIIYTTGLKPSGDVVAIAEANGIVIMSTKQKTRVFIHESTILMARLGAPRASIYGTMVEVCGLGVLFEGDPGLGKSETALGLLKRGYALVADDLTCIRKDVVNNLIYGSASDSTAGFMEIRGIGIIKVTSIFGAQAVRGEKRLQLVLTFKKLKDIEGEIDRVGGERRFRDVLGVKIPQLIIPVSEGRDLVNLVEIAAQQQKALDAGHDPVLELSERLRRRADAKAEAAAAVREAPKPKCKRKGK